VTLLDARERTAAGGPLCLQQWFPTLRAEKRSPKNGAPDFRGATYIARCGSEYGTNTGMGATYIARYKKCADGAGLDPHQFLLHSAGDDCFARFGNHVHLTAHAELRQIDSRLYRKARAGKNLAFIVRFQVVEIGPIAV
jgi:hypothetical protein